MKYYAKIDGLRCVAISFVLIEHFANIAGRHISAGYYGVDLFFVISGFLITSILLKPNEQSFKTNYKNFIGRRTLRIFPLYYFAILILWLLNLPVIREKLIWFLTYTFNYAWVLYDLPRTPVNHFWSLSVEEQFYLFWPLILLSLKNRPKQLLAIILCIIVFGYTQMIFNIIPVIGAYNYTGLLTRMSSLGLGALGAILSRQNLLPVNLFQNKYIEYLVFFILSCSLLFSYSMKPFVLGICSGYIVLKAAHGNFFLKPVEIFLANKHVIYIGTLAYGIYIFHLPLSYYFTKYIFVPVWTNIDFSNLGIFGKLRWHSWIIKFPLYTLLSIFIASLSYKYIERPVLKLKDKWFKY